MMFVQGKIFITPLSYVMPFVVLFSASFSQTMWQRVYGGPGGESGYCVDQTTDGGYIVVGHTGSFGNGSQIYLIETDSLGDTLWTRVYGGTGDDRGMCIQQTTDRGYIIVGHTNSFGNGFQIYLIKTDSLGDTVWSRIYGDTADEYGYSVQQTQDGGFIVAGSAVQFELFDPVYLIKTDILGDTIWTKSYNVGQGRSARQTRDGGYIVVGYDGWHIILTKTNSIGDTIWTKQYGGVTTLDYGYSVQQTYDGGYIIAGSANYPYPEWSQVYLIKTDSLGDTIWTRKYGGEGHHSWGLSVQQTTDSGYIVVGSTSEFALGVVYLIKTNSSGDSIWSKIYGQTTYRSCGYSVQQTWDEGYIIAGRTDIDSLGHNTQVYLIKTDQYGNSGIEDANYSGRLRYTPHLVAYPNPFKNAASIKFQIPSTNDQVKSKSQITIKIYDATGRLVRQWNKETARQGDEVVWDGTDDSGYRLPPGVYFCSLESGKTTMTTKIIKLE